MGMDSTTPIGAHEEHRTCLCDVAVREIAMEASALIACELITMWRADARVTRPRMGPYAVVSRVKTSPGDGQRALGEVVHTY